MLKATFGPEERATSADSIINQLIINPNSKHLAFGSFWSGWHKARARGDAVAVAATTAK